MVKAVLSVVMVAPRETVESEPARNHPAPAWAAARGRRRSRTEGPLTRMKGFLILPRQDVLLAMAVMVLVSGRVVGQTQGGDEPVFTPGGGSTSLLGPSPGA